jgi:predicted RNA-binding Zn-ribbon protein involved in translation (DUF1610 family)
MSDANNVVHVSFAPVPAAQTDPAPTSTPAPTPDSASTTPHLAGVAICIDCAHEWVAVIPPGEISTRLECPHCRAHKGHMKYQISPGVEEWTCACGNDLFRVTRTHLYCPHCGTIPELP